MDINNIHILPMAMEHLGDVVEIERAVFKNPWTFDMYKAEVLKDYSHHYVLIYDDEVVGFFGYFETSEDEAEVTNIAIKPDYQGAGLGNCIMNYMLDTSREYGVNKIFLETRYTNKVARTMYEKYGFSLINIRKKYYDGEEDACIYMWQRC